MSENDILDTHLQELRRGTIVLACLLILQKPDYGYALIEALEERGFAVDANTLYPLLRRLEKQGLLASEWDTAETRPRKFYRTSPDGLALAEVLTAEWRQLDTAFDTLKETS